MTGSSAGRAGPRRTLRDYPLAVFVLALATLPSVMIGSYHNIYRAISTPLLASIARGRPVMVWASDPAWSWSMVESLGLRRTSGYHARWMLPAIGHAELACPADLALTRLGAEVRARCCATHPT